MDAWRHNFTGVRWQYPGNGWTLYGAVDDVWVQPDGTVLVGATVEDVGFDESLTDEGCAGLRAMAAALIPALAEAPLQSFGLPWARTCTPSCRPCAPRRWKATLRQSGSSCPAWWRR